MNKRCPRCGKFIGKGVESHHGSYMEICKACGTEEVEFDNKISKVKSERKRKQMKLVESEWFRWHQMEENFYHDVANYPEMRLDPLRGIR